MTRLSAFAANWSELSALLDEALALPVDRHDAWLASAPAPHREALRDLLSRRAEVETGDFLGELPGLPFVPAATAAHELAPGVRIGPYSLVSEAGRGGMSSVWLAERSDGTLKRRVALKLPRQVWGDVFAERLARERDILAALTHEHIARLYDAGVDAAGRPFLAMEFVEGRPIDEFARAGPLDIDARIDLLLQVCAAVAHAHSRLVVHRDLKPSNILVGEDGRVKLLDFGIAKLLEGTSTRSSALTELAGRALTPDYASPEQIRGEPLGTASDVYSLGLVAYELLAEGRPYRLKRGSAAEMEDAIAHAEPRLASTAAATPALARRLRGDLDAILNKALKKRVAERYASVEALADDLVRYRAGRPVLARPDRRGYRAAKFVARNRLAVGMGTALSLAVVGGAGMSLWQAREARQQEQRAVAEVVRQTAVRDLYLETLNRVAVIGTDDPGALREPHSITAALRDKLAEMALRFKDKPAGRAAQLEAVMLQLNYADQFEDSLAVGREYLAHLQAHGGSAGEVINAYTAIGRTLFKLGRREESEAMRRAGAAWAPEVHDDRTEIARMEIGSDLASVLTARGARAEAADVLTRAEALVQRRFPNEALHAMLLMQLSIFWTTFDDAKSLAYARRSCDIVKALGAAPDEMAYQQTYLGTALMANGLSTEAEAVLKQAYANTLPEFPRGSSSEVRALARIAAAVAQQGDPARAGKLLDDEERELAARPGGVPAVATLQLHWRRAEIAWLAGDTRVAAAWSPTQTAAWLAPARLRETALALNAIARGLALGGRVDEASGLIDAVIAGWPEPGLPSFTWLRLLETQAVVRLAQGRDADAGRSAQALVKMLRDQHATEGRAFVNAIELAALAAARQGDRDTAARLLDSPGPTPTPPFATRVAEAESLLRRAEAMARLDRGPEAVKAARSALAGLQGQAADSPRLALARSLANDR